MPESLIRKVLNKLKWDSEDLDECEISFLHRGAPDDMKMYPGQKIKEIASSYLIFLDEEEEEVVIPFHRLRKIYNKKTNRLIWEKNS
jgi:uncharacterized protein (UPF0248 family)